MSSFKDGKVKNLGKVFAGGTPKTENAAYYGKGHYWLPSGRVQNTILTMPKENEAQITDLGLKESSAKLIKPNSVLVAITGSTCSNVALLKFEATANQSVVAIEPNSNVDSNYLFYGMLNVKDEIIKNKSGGAQGGVNLDIIKNLPMRLPDLTTQQRIAAFLDSETGKVDNLVDELTKFKGKLQTQRKSLISECVTKGIPSERDRAYKDSGVEWLGDIPAGWEIRTAKSFVKSLNGGIWGLEKGEDEFDVRCLRVADFDRSNNKTQDSNSTIRSYKYSQIKDKMLKNGDLIIEKSGGGEQSPVGNVVLYDLDEPAMYSNFVARIRLKEDIKSIFALYLFQTMYNQKINTRSIRQTTGIQNLNTNSYLSEKVSLPPLNEQQHVADYLDAETAKIDALIGEIDNQVNLLKTYRKSLINEVVTGKVEV